jgi:hypothetical protein
MDEYQLFIRKTTTDIDRKRKAPVESKENIILDFLHGKDWPSNVEPVVHYVPKEDTKSVPLLGVDGIDDFQLQGEGVPATLGKFLKQYLTKRHFWWDREDEEDVLAQEVMALMPRNSQTTLATACMGWDGRVRFAIFASWNKPPSSFGDTASVALPFVWILSGSIMASLAVRKMRTLEQSQISYSNLQAQ